MRNVRSLLLVCVLGLGSVAPASAALITIDPNNYASGTGISNATPGVTLSFLTVASTYGTGLPQPAVLSPIYSIDCRTQVSSSYCASPIGNSVFGHDPYAGMTDTNFFASTYGNEGGLLQGGLVVPNGGVYDFNVAAFRADFTKPTNFVNVIFNASGSGDVGGIAAYDSNFNLVAYCVQSEGWYTPPPCGSVLGSGASGTFFSFSVFSGTSNISHIVVDGVLALDDLQFVAPAGVPEPATLSLLGLGVVGVGFMRRRKAA